jgi:hypothetical protein
MIFESDYERKAFEFVCILAGMATDRGCNDLANETADIFNGITVDCDDGGKIIQRPIQYDFDVIYWLKKQVKFS